VVQAIKETVSVEKRHSTGQHWRCDEGMDHVRQDFIWSPKKPISQASAVLQMSQMTIHRILLKSLCLYPYTVQIIQKLAASNKQLR
jgi:hypothetical protein